MGVEGMVRRGNPDKLQPVQSKQEASERGRKGGLASGAARREKKTLRQCLEVLLDAPSEQLEKMSNREALAVSMLQKALGGDVRAAEVIRDTVGEKPVDAVKIDLSAKFSEMSLDEKDAALAAYMAQRS